jgi:dynein heavy chain
VLITDYDSSQTFSCPVYKTHLRAGVVSSTGHSTNYIASFDLKSDIESDHWIMRGAALICQINE